MKFMTTLLSLLAMSAIPGALGYGDEEPEVEEPKEVAPKTIQKIKWAEKIKTATKTSYVIKTNEVTRTKWHKKVEIATKTVTPAAPKSTAPAEVKGKPKEPEPEEDMGY
ncbi:hypothetical protein TWF730_003222 [Orbilia blumenaviensis]|uniref:Uncharacterized protein n=1 Tax=Orbilia blumenaviensis TaxID=1796055 RepID=A0AAV9U4W6_9PEZI